MSDFFKSMIKEIGNDEASLMHDGTGSAEFNTFIDTGSYTLNVAFSGSLFGGIPDNKVSALAGVSAVGKTYLLLGMIRSFLKHFPDAGCFFFDTEGATTKKMIEDRGIDTKNIILLEPTTVEEFKNQALKALLAYENSEPKTRPRMFMALDSLGQLSTNKEMIDSAAGKDVKDMTRAQVIKAAFRVLTLKCAKLHVPMVITNHTYANILSYGAPQVMSGGEALKFAASTILMLSKSKSKEGTGADTEVVGSNIKVKINKGRLSRENQEVETRIMYDGGIDRYYGLLDMAIESGVFKKMSTKVITDTGESIFGKEIEEHPKQYFTDKVLKDIDVWVKKNYQYGVFADTSDIVEKSKELDIEIEEINNETATK